MSFSKHERAGGTGSTPTHTAIPANISVIELHASNLSVDNLDLIVTKSNEILVRLLITGIIGWNVYQNVTLLIITDDQNPVALTFVNTTELGNAVLFLDNSMGI